MIDLLAQFTPSDLQAWLSVEVGFGMTLGTVLLVIAGSTLGLPLLHPGVRESAKNMLPGNKKSNSDETPSQ